ncbi:MAG: glycosyltransferase family 39 protein [Gemmatimonadetes bacterium]|nr:glycosyltransferase family 39 protein [Gemmatimonadota bacterium]
MSAPAARADAPQAGAPRDAGPGASWPAAALAAVLVLACALASVTPHPVGVFWDDGVYLLSAQALAAGDGYRYMYLPGTPPAIHYPPAFPLLLAALLKVTPAFPANVAILKMLNPLCLAVGVFGAVRLATRHFDMAAVPAALAVAVCALTAPVLVLTNVLLSESFFFAVLIGALWLVERAVRDGGVRDAAWAGVAIAALTLVRTVGGVMLPAAVAVLWWRHRRREAAVLAACAVVALMPWQVWVWQAARGFPDELRGSYGPYLEWVIGGYRREPALMWEVFARNVADLWRAFGLIFAPRLPRVMQWGAAIAVIGTLGLGLLSLLRRGSALAAFLVAYGGVVLLWPYSPERFVWAVWPLAAIVLLAGARSAGAWGARRWPHAPRAAAAVVALLLAGHAAYAARGLAGGWAGSPQRAMTERLWPLVEWTVTHAGEKDVVASDAHVMIALYTGRTTMPVSMLTPAEHVRDKPLPQYARELSALAARYRPQLLVLSRQTPERDAVPLWAQTPGAPAVTPLPPIPGGGAAFALRERP